MCLVLDAIDWGIASSSRPVGDAGLPPVLNIGRGLGAGELAGMESRGKSIGSETIQQRKYWMNNDLRTTNEIGDHRDFPAFLFIDHRLFFRTS
jgi:hypothetical protein